MKRKEIGCNLLFSENATQVHGIILIFLLIYFIFTFCKKILHHTFKQKLIRFGKSVIIELRGNLLHKSFHKLYF